MKTFKVDGKIYSREALKLAAFVCGEGKISVQQKANNIEIAINEENPEQIFKELLNEALNQQCRIDLVAKNSKIANIISTKALLSAMGEK